MAANGTSNKLQRNLLMSTRSCTCPLCLALDPAHCQMKKEDLSLMYSKFAKVGIIRQDGRGNWVPVPAKEEEAKKIERFRELDGITATVAGKADK